jgi:hypothetical protein
MKRITFSLVSILCIAACNNEVINIEREHQVIELRIPDAKVVSVYSTAAKSENWINQLYVIEYDLSGTIKDYQPIDCNSAQFKYYNGNAALLLPQLGFEPIPENRIVCIANLNVNNDISSISQYSDINANLPLDKESYSGGDYLPMYGEMIWRPTSSLICEMTRAVAKIQVKMGTSVPDVTNDFTAENVSYKIYDAAAGGYIKESVTNQEKSQQSAGHTSDTKYYLLQKDGATEAEINAYIHEYPTSTKTSTGGDIDRYTFDKDRQHIILKKTVGNSTTYYRLDFYDPTIYNTNTGKYGGYIDTKRNHHYIFTIQKVRSEGYATEGEAHLYPGSNIEYILKIEDDSKSISSNGQYAIITSVDTAYIRSTGTVNDSIIATARYQLPTEITTPPTSEIGVSAVTPASSMELGNTSILTLGPTNGEIRVTVTNAAFTEGVITLKLGNITHRLYVKRKQP